MPEYIYLLENRLSAAQKHALAQVREAAREAGMTVFLTGGAVRDLTTGSSVRNFNFSVQGNALELESGLLARGAELWGTHEPTRALTLWFPGSVRADVASTRSEEYPKPGKPVYTWSTIVEDLRRRDFTANAMALSLNEGSYGLLLDPLNGVADIEARLLRVASNYGFIEDPSRLIRLIRLQKRLGWQIEERTSTRYANAKEAESIKALSPYLRGSELEKIASEEDALDTVKALEAEGWMEHLFAAWTSAMADVAGLESLRRNWIQLLMQGVVADLTVTHLELLTAHMQPADIALLKKTLVRPGLVRQWEGLDESAKEFSKLLTGKASAAPSATWKLLTTHAAEPILWLAHTRKAGAVDTKFKSFFTVWPEFKKKVPAAMMLEMRITPELPGYADLLEQLFYQLIDGNLETDEQMRAFLEPWSPPAPPPPPTVRRSRAKKSESKTKRRISAPDDEEDEDSDENDADAEEDAEGEEEDEPVEDDALSKVLDKLHGDETTADDDLDADEPAAEADEDEDDDDPPPSSPAKPAAGKGAQEDGVTPTGAKKKKPAFAEASSEAPAEAAPPVSPSLLESVSKQPSGSSKTATAASSPKVAQASKRPVRSAAAVKEAAGSATSVTEGVAVAAKSAATKTAPAKAAPVSPSAAKVEPVNPERPKTAPAKKSAPPQTEPDAGPAAKKASATPTAAKAPSAKSKSTGKH